MLTKTQNVLWVVAEYHTMGFLKAELPPPRPVTRRTIYIKILTDLIHTADDGVSRSGYFHLKSNYLIVIYLCFLTKYFLAMSTRRMITGDRTRFIAISKIKLPNARAKNTSIPFTSVPNPTVVPIFVAYL